MAGGESVASPSYSEAQCGRGCSFCAPPAPPPPGPSPLLISGDGLGRVCQSVGWGRVVLYAQKPGWELTHQLT